MHKQKKNAFREKRLQNSFEECFDVTCRIHDDSLFIDPLSVFSEMKLL